MAHMYCPEHIWEDHSLKLSEKIVYGVVEGLTKKEGYCYATNEFIGINLEMSGDTVSRNISSLAKKGKLRVEVAKTRKEDGSPLEWGTKRKIYIYLNESADGLGKNPIPRASKIPSIIDIDNKVEGETPSFSSESLYKDFKPADQLALLRSVMGIFDSIDYEAVLLRVRNSKSRGSFLETIYHWWFQDIHDGKIGSNLYIYNADAVYVDAMPTTFVEAQNLMNQKLIENEKIKPGFISSFVTTTPKYDL